MFQIILIVVIVVIAYMVIRALSAGWPRQPDQPPWPQAPRVPGVPETRFHVEPAADGFWIDPIGYPPGSVIHYRCYLGGMLQQSTAEVETGRRQFIYTGDPPTDIVITQILPPSGMMPPPRQPSVWPIPIPTPGTPPRVTEYPTATPATPVEETTGGGDFGGEPTPSAAPAEEPAAPAGGYPSAY
jgi:hypothetical protein